MATPSMEESIDSANNSSYRLLVVMDGDGGGGNDITSYGDYGVDGCVVGGGERERERVGCFSSRVRHLLHLHVASGMQRYLLRLRQCFANNQQAMVQEGQMLIEYVMMNAIAIQKILKKYDKVHSSVNGRNFKSKMQAEHTEILQSPWLIELGAFYMNFNKSYGGGSDEISSPFFCDLSATEPVLTLRLPDSVKLEYYLTCGICLLTDIDRNKERCV
ncbi:probable E3 ubiquitin-protein ligase BAH1-like [Cornus florida]|uniref:probable E3 ubiquitin-protein ligase BAH1-like n=1 Tax=Cornus florida TaxID=4283 RepID=UPI0028A161DB|nr:probable E3 ubiquitin-protein ligase BAH1-like [Cornus florida]